MVLVVLSSHACGCGGHSGKGCGTLNAQPEATGDVVSFRRIWHRANGTTEMGTDWAAGGSFAAIVYSTYSEAHYMDWGEQYISGGRGAVNEDFSKPGSGSAGAKDRHTAPEFVAFHAGYGPSEGEHVRACYPVCWVLVVCFVGFHIRKTCPTTEVYFRCALRHSRGDGHLTSPPRRLMSCNLHGCTCRGCKRRRRVSCK